MAPLTKIFGAGQKKTIGEVSNAGKVKNLKGKLAKSASQVKALNDDATNYVNQRLGGNLEIYQRRAGVKKQELYEYVDSVKQGEKDRFARNNPVLNVAKEIGQGTARIVGTPLLKAAEAATGTKNLGKSIQYDSTAAKIFGDDIRLGKSVGQENKELFKDILGDGVTHQILGGALTVLDYSPFSFSTKLIKSSPRKISRSISNYYEKQGVLPSRATKIEIKKEIERLVKLGDTKALKEGVDDIIRKTDLEYKVENSKGLYKELILVDKQPVNQYMRGAEFIGDRLDPVLGDTSRIIDFKNRMLKSVANKLDDNSFTDFVKKKLFTYEYPLLKQIRIRAGFNVSEKVRKEGTVLEAEQLMLADAKIEIIRKDSVSLNDWSIENFGNIDEGRKLVDEYTIARHARERNKTTFDGGSSMTNAQVDEYFAKIKDSKHYEFLKEYGEKLKEHSKDNLVMGLENNLLSLKSYNNFSHKFKNHVPLGRDLEDIDGIFKHFDIPSAKAGITDQFKKAKGSDREVKDILGQLAERNARTRKVIAVNNRRLGMKNLFLNSKAQFEGFWEDLSYIQAKEKGLLDNASLVPYLEKGEKRFMNFKGSFGYRMADALTGKNIAKAGPIWNALGTVTRLMASLATSKNPEFLVTNFFRDFYESSMIAISDSQSYKEAIRQKRFTVKALKIGRQFAFKTTEDIDAILKGGSKDAELLGHYKDFISGGGSMGGISSFGRKDLDDLVRTSKDGFDGKSNAVLNTFRKVPQFLDKINETVENSSRFSAYMSTITQGGTKLDAVINARNITVDFAQKGEWSKNINSWSMFFNASVQGNARFLTALHKSPKMILATFGSIWTLNTLQDGWNTSYDEEWEKAFSPHELNSNFIFITGNGADGMTYQKIPVAYGVRPIYTATRNMFNPEKSSLETLQATIESFGDTYNPIGGSSLSQAWAPTPLKPLIAVSENKSWSGSDIRPDYKEGLPSPEQVWSQPETAFEFLTQSFSEGLDNFGFEKSPEDIRYLIKQYGSGAGNAAVAATDTIGNAIDGKFSASETVLVRKLFGHKKPEAIIKQKWKRTREKHLNNLKDIKEPLDRKVYMQEYIKEVFSDVDLRNEEDYKSAQKQVQKFLNDLRYKGFDIGGVSTSSKPRRPQAGDSVDRWLGYYNHFTKNYTSQEAKQMAASKSIADEKNDN